jgi:hypothetical protein
MTQEFIYEDDKDPFANHTPTGVPQKVIKGSLNENILEILKQPPIKIDESTLRNIQPN